VLLVSHLWRDIISSQSVNVSVHYTRKKLNTNITVFLSSVNDIFLSRVYRYTQYDIDIRVLAICPSVTCQHFVEVAKHFSKE